MRVLLTCEHASGELPPGVDLGLEPAVLRSHVSCDRGALGIAVALAGRLGAPLHHGRYSRLWVDLNRRAENPAVILERTYGIVVPGNVGLDAAAREARIAADHAPYRAAALADAQALAAEGHCLHLSLHSFDPSLDPDARAFDVGVLFDPSRRPEAPLAVALAEALRARGRAARLNEPYLGTPEGLTSWMRERLPEERYSGLEIEASQGWMRSDDDLESFAAALQGALGALEPRFPGVTPP